MNNWIKAFNPAATIATEADAVRAARASAVAIFLGVAVGILGIVMLTAGGGIAAMEAAMSTAISEQGGEAAGMAGAAGMFAQAMLYMLIITTVIQLVLGFVQWRKPNSVIPILFIVLIVFGIGSGVLNQMQGASMNAPETPMNAPWLYALKYVVMVIQLILHTSGVRGASALSKFRAAQAY